jgi:sensor domain CHASE-containing protein
MTLLLWIAVGVCLVLLLAIVVVLVLILVQRHQSHRQIADRLDLLHDLVHNLTLCRMQLDSTLEEHLEQTKDSSSKTP